MLAEITGRRLGTAISPGKAAGYSLFIILCASGFLAISMRLVGTMFLVPVLAETLPAQAVYMLFSLIIFGILLVSRVRVSSAGALFVLCSLFILFLLVVHLIASPPAQEGAWNTTPFELARTFALQAMLLAPVLLVNSADMSDRFAGRAVKLVLFTGLGMVVVSVFQVFGLMPNFFHQWYGSDHLPRPTGGLEHPHFFAAYLVVATAASRWLNITGRISKQTYLLCFFALVAGVVISTSRVGVIMLIVYLVVSNIHASLSNAKRLLAKFFGVSVAAGFVVVATMIVWKSFPGTAVGGFLEVFFSAFVDSFSGTSNGDFLRGRGDRWSHEIHLITIDATHFLFGYGHQPYVSHNLILRQMQVSGLLGTAAYLWMILFYLGRLVARSAKSARSIMFALAAALLVSSTTFPVLVSVTIVSATSLFFLCSSAHANSMARGASAKLSP